MTRLRTDSSALYDRCASRVRDQAAFGLEHSLGILRDYARSIDAQETQHSLLISASRSMALVEDTTSARLSAAADGHMSSAMYAEALASLLAAIDIEPTPADDE